MALHEFPKYTYSVTNRTGVEAGTATVTGTATTGLAAPAIDHEKLSQLRKDFMSAQREITRLQEVIALGEKAAAELRKNPPRRPPDRTVIPTPIMGSGKEATLAARLERLIDSTADSIIGRNGQAEVWAVPSEIVSHVRARVMEKGLKSAVAKAPEHKRGPKIVCQGDW